MNSQEILSISNRVVEEVKKVILKLKNGKAAGLDKIIPELRKAFDDNVIDIIALILIFSIAVISLKSELLEL